MKERAITLILLSLLVIQDLSAQKEDYVWPIGYRGNADTLVQGIGPMNINFKELSPEVLVIKRDMAMASNSSSICHQSTGDLLFYTNGLDILNKNHKLMKGGEDITTTRFRGDTRAQSTVILPWPERDSMYLILYRRKEFVYHPLDSSVAGSASVEPLYGIVDLKEDGGFGALIERDIPLVNDTLTDGRFTACRHGNGRDWWIFMGKWASPKMYVFLLDPSGIKLSHTELLEPNLPFQFGRAEFTPDGQRYILRLGNFGESVMIETVIYEFDRCTGHLVSLVERYTEATEYPASEAGIAISPSSRFLYAPVDDYFLQYDLWAADIANSAIEVARYDGFFDPFNTWFMFPVFAPDGKIYVVPTQTAGSWHTVHAPDSLGTACRVIQHDLDLPTYNFGTSHNFPHFRLGPEVGSSCDTLNIDKGPIALFRDESRKLHVWFTDLSYYNPDTWYWEFGDGNASQDRLPVHDYRDPGDYYVCLTVSNPYGEHTWCDSITVDSIITHTKDAVGDLKPVVYPNPTGGPVWIDNSNGGWQQYEVMSLGGKSIIAGDLPNENHKLDLSQVWPETGVVLINLKDAAGRASVIKVVRQ